MHQTRSNRNDCAFTMVELLVVILIIAILVGLLVPVIIGAVRTANAARCVADINNFQTAMTQFKSTFGDFPPSRILIYESGYYPVSVPPPGSALLPTTPIANVYQDARADASMGSLTQRSVRYLQKFWPRCVLFNTTDYTKAVPWDINGDGQVGGWVNGSFNQWHPFMLTGDECLVFFLGGQAQFTVGSSGETVIGMQGFSRDPANPFNWLSTSRTTPTFQFNGGRLVDPDGDRFPSYLDTYGSTDPGSRPYAYFASYGGGNYDPNDCNTDIGHDEFSPTRYINTQHAVDDGFFRAFNVAYPVNATGGNSCYGSFAAVSVGPNPYTASAPAFQTGLARVVWQNPDSFQIVSAGSDQVFGVGGSFSTTANAGSLANTDNGGLCSGPNGQPSRSPENDNLTNFYNSRLQ